MPETGEIIGDGKCPTIPTSVSMLEEADVCEATQPSIHVTRSSTDCVSGQKDTQKSDIHVVPIPPLQLSSKSKSLNDLAKSAASYKTFASIGGYRSAQVSPRRDDVFSSLSSFSTSGSSSSSDSTPSSSSPHSSPRCSQSQPPMIRLSSPKFLKRLFADNARHTTSVTFGECTTMCSQHSIHSWLVVSGVPQQQPSAGQDALTKESLWMIRSTPSWRTGSFVALAAILGKPSSTKVTFVGLAGCNVRVRLVVKLRAGQSTLSAKWTVHVNGVKRVVRLAALAETLP